ncbi:pyridoxamine 5'-phosphate oxidase family protein [Iodidimonas sp. SYSU 1G8]|uniref:pyridoxamine 5'-phosphate oxidase family protein n=1 Tax=Iodidimonas sp. SYSU 1G8 TaxID=3133967 RepID=UPI0031FF30C3
MREPHEFEEKFWKALDSERTMMLGLAGVEEPHPRPMTGLIEGKHGPIWFFTSRESELVGACGAGASRAIGTFTSKGHDLFATVRGTLVIDNDREAIERLWNPMIAAWYEGGKDDPDLVLLRFDAERAEIWLDANSLIAGVKMLLGIDPKKDYRDKVADVSLS